MRLRNKLAVPAQSEKNCCDVDGAASERPSSLPPPPLLRLSHTTFTTREQESDINRRRKRGDVFALASFPQKAASVELRGKLCTAAENDSGGGFSGRIGESSLSLSLAVFAWRWRAETCQMVTF